MFPGLQQLEVDFVIPRAGQDLPLGIDPFLLFKSRDDEYRELHSRLVVVFETAFAFIRRGKLNEAQRLLHFPEPPEIGLGYTAKGKTGSGVGSVIQSLLLETINATPQLLERGIRHVEEMQLISVGIGPDRVSDIAANVFKEFLVSYTQKQSLLWSLPNVKNVPVHHILDTDEMEWTDQYVDLPIDPISNLPVLLVPRRWVRALPWINYDDFLKSEFSSFLRASLPGSRANRPRPKAEAVPLTRNKLDRVEQYISAKEADSSRAQPTQVEAKGEACEEATRLGQLLDSLPSGKKFASEYQKLILAILNYLFNPELIDGEMEVKTIDGTERRDIIFTNDSDHSFWDYVRNEHSSLLMMFEVKNTESLTPTNYNQTGTYLGDRLGRFGIVVTRNEATIPNVRKAFSIYNDSTPRKVILTLTDNDLKWMLRDRCEGRSPTEYLRKLYRKFKQSVQ